MGYLNSKHDKPGCTLGEGVSPGDRSSLVKGVPRAGRHTGFTSHAHPGPRDVAVWSIGWGHILGGQRATADLQCLPGVQEGRRQCVCHISHCWPRGRWTVSHGENERQVVPQLSGVRRCKCELYGTSEACIPPAHSCTQSAHPASTESLPCGRPCARVLGTQR